MVRITAILALTLISLLPAAAQELQGDFLYKVETVRAASGSLSGLLDWLESLKESEYFDDSGLTPPFVMRHSQGDQWDLMIIVPMQSWKAYYSPAAALKRENAATTHASLLSSGRSMIAFQEDHFAFGPPLSVVQTSYDNNNFFHIEMFKARAGKATELFEQRRMENAYLAATGQTRNLIFRRSAGSDIDVFTIGFHKSLEAFATPAGVDIDEKNTAAIAAGFKGLNDISFYLRSLISGHHDTLAVKVE